MQAVALEAELRVSKQRLAAAPKNNARAEVELERRADLQFLRGQNDQAWATGLCKRRLCVRLGVGVMWPQLRKECASIFEEKRQVERQLEAYRKAELERQVELESARCGPAQTDPVAQRANEWACGVGQKRRQYLVAFALSLCVCLNAFDARSGVTCAAFQQAQLFEAERQ